MSLWERLKQIRDGFTTFLSNEMEWHAFVIGFCEILCPWPTHYKLPPEYIANGNPLKEEWHYMVFGRAVGFICLLWIVIPVTCLIFKAIFGG